MTYNVNGQMASLNWGAAPGSTGYAGPTGGIQYSYSATQNNGQITQAVDTLSGETIGYQYDALKRLTSAASTPTRGSSTAPWTQTFQYDGFSNLTAKVLNGTTTPIAVNTPTNQLSSAYYDANGNMTSGAGATLTYDVSNRLASAVETSGGIEYYGYAPDNKRVFRQMANGHQLITLYGVQGEKLSVFDLTANAWVATYVWFGGKLISDGNAVYGDRLGTNRASGARFMPFGDEITSTANDHVKFGTYTRDSYTGLDYADQRFYASTYGRFSTPDPYAAGGASSGNSSNPSDPVSWNRYAYTGGDPINRSDPGGEDWCDATNVNLVIDGLVSTSTGCGNWGGGLAGYFPDIGSIVSNSIQNAVSSAVSTAVSSAEQSAPQQLCPLDVLIGNYTETNAWPVVAEFAPQMAEDVDQALLILQRENITPQINSGYRSVASQASIPTNNPYPTAPPGQSWHNVGLAIDIQLNPATSVGQMIIAAMESAGLTWGGTFTSPRPDNVHFQLPPSVTSSKGISSGAPSPFQVAACQAEHPLGH